MATKSKAEIAKIARKNPKLAKQLELRRQARNKKVQAKRRAKRQAARLARRPFVPTPEPRVIENPALPEAAQQTFSVAHTKRKDIILTPDKMEVYTDGVRVQTTYDVLLGAKWADAQKAIGEATGAFAVVIHDLRDLA